MNSDSTPHSPESEQNLEVPSRKRQWRGPEKSKDVVPRSSKVAAVSAGENANFNEEIVCDLPVQGADGIVSFGDFNNGYFYLTLFQAFSQDTRQCDSPDAVAPSQNIVVVRPRQNLFVDMGALRSSIKQRSQVCKSQERKRRECENISVEKSSDMVDENQADSLAEQHLSVMLE